MITGSLYLTMCYFNLSLSSCGVNAIPDQSYYLMYLLI